MDDLGVVIPPVVPEVTDPAAAGQLATISIGDEDGIDRIHSSVRRVTEYYSVKLQRSSKMVRKNIVKKRQLFNRKKQTILEIESIKQTLSSLSSGSNSVCKYITSSQPSLLSPPIPLSSPIWH